MIDPKLAPPCGLLCKDCDYLHKQCEGCGHMKGKPFWITETNMHICPIYDCCRNTKQLEHCGLCEYLPCQVFVELRDPSLSDKEFYKSLQNRKEKLMIRKKIGTDTWLSNYSYTKP
ncbi:MAG: DUF3795 domain-containing protein [Thermodesulfobacteriota bacterium]|nr:DUF3795 domain-containing protein [Thermodesulfobacteriota bacterium]